MDEAHLKIKSTASDADVFIQGNDGGTGITALRFDMSAAGAATFNDKITAVGTSVFTNLDISGDIDVDGTANLDVVDIDGAVDMASTLQVDGVATFSSVPVFPNNTIETADVQDNAITLAKMAGGTDGNLITYDASGDPAYVATGSDGQVLTSTGAGSPPAFETLAVSLTPYWMGSRQGNQVPQSGATTKLTFSEYQDSDNAFDDGNDKFTVPTGKGGRYFITAGGTFYSNSSNRVTDAVIYIYKNGSQVNEAYQPLGSQYSANPGANAVSSSISAILNLSADDYIEVYGVVTTNSGAVSFGASNFSGFRLGD